jgi:hypothetical protein
VFSGERKKGQQPNRGRYTCVSTSTVKLTHPSRAEVGILHEVLLRLSKVPVPPVPLQQVSTRELKRLRPPRYPVEMRQQCYGVSLVTSRGIGIGVLCREVDLSRVLLVSPREQGTAVQKDERGQVDCQPGVVRPLLEYYVKQGTNPGA